jgi:hypothetical protein
MGSRDDFAISFQSILVGYERIACADTQRSNHLNKVIPEI